MTRLLAFTVLLVGVGCSGEPSIVIQPPIAVEDGTIVEFQCPPAMPEDALTAYTRDASWNCFCKRDKRMLLPIPSPFNGQWVEETP